MTANSSVSNTPVMVSDVEHLLKMLNQPNQCTASQISDQHASPWGISSTGISHEERKFFAVNFYKINKGSNEWTQPLMEPSTIPNGIVGIFYGYIKDELLVQVDIREEPGNDLLSLGPSFQTSRHNPLYQIIEPFICLGHRRICRCDPDRYMRKENDLILTKVGKLEDFPPIGGIIVPIKVLSKVYEFHPHFVGEHLLTMLGALSLGS